MGINTCLAAAVTAAIALGTCASEASAARTFRPRVGAAMGIVPPLGHDEIAIGTNLPVVYHGGSVMRGRVRIHTVFWAPRGFRFTGSPGGGVPGYERLIQQFLADVARDSGALSNVFSVLNQYPDGGGPGSYEIAYRPAVDSVDDRDRYPPLRHQCASPSGTATCVTDLEVQHELDRVIGARHRNRGLHELWFVFLPPDVDTCADQGQCGTNEFAGYHSLSNVGHGPVIYSIIVDPLIEAPAFPGADPEGNPEAEFAIDTTAHEAVEAITNPTGVGWMDPNGFEVADKCEDGPQDGKPLGAAPNGSPYNQLIAGHRYLIQGIWSNRRRGCVERARATTAALPQSAVSLDQFSPRVRGRIGAARAGVPVRVALLRAGHTVARGSGRTRGDGSWGPVSLGAHAVGDDRDELVIRYGAGGDGRESNTVRIKTGSGGNPFFAAGWTGWLALDRGYRIRRHSILLAPCGQTGVLAVTVNGSATAPPIDTCQTETDVSVVHTPAIGPATALRMSSEDNRASSTSTPNGSLVKLTIPLGERGGVSLAGNDQIQFDPSGFPACIAELRVQGVRCTGLVPGRRYAVARRRRHAVRRGSADADGVLFVSRFPGGVVGGDLLTLSNRAGRKLTALHVAHLRVDIRGSQTVIASGRCEPGDYYGPPLQRVPVSGAVGSGVSGNGTICPLSGNAAGLGAGQIEQTDDFSGGLTRTEVPVLEGNAPTNDATLYGPFVALAQTGLPGPNGSVIRTGDRVALAIFRDGGRGRPVFGACDAARPGGVAVARLAQGAYTARWVLIDANGDTRTVVTHFVEAG